jgi:DNA-binding NtrC family response regulator
MKENVVLLVDADGDSVGIVLEAAARIGHTARLAKTSREAFEILKREIRRLDIVIVDVDPGAHGLALLEAISGRAERLPIIVVTALEETYMKPITAEHGATACLANRSGSKRSSPRLMRCGQEVTNVNVRFADFLHAFVLHFETGGTNAIRPCH